MLRSFVSSALILTTCETSGLSPLYKVVFGSFPYKMPFDYQMVTFEEIIKNDFFKWAQFFIVGKIFFPSWINQMESL